VSQLAGDTGNGLVTGLKAALDSDRFQDKDFLGQTSRNHLRQGHPEWFSRVVQII
jgi:hypothetical protein